MLDTPVGPYRLERELGSGGMGTVYLASVLRPVEGLVPGDRVAIKVVHPHLLSKHGYFKRFLREAELGRRVDHPNVVGTRDVDAAEVDGQVLHYLVMEYVEGRTLRDLLADLTCVPEVLLREIALQVGEGLAAIHAAGIVHRDLKPENVLITSDHQVRIMDLGVAHLLESSVHLTGQGEFLGSLLYAAPEQLTGKTAGPAADLYGVGVLLYELATGTNPYMRPDAGAVIRAHLEDSPPPLQSVQDGVSDFLAEVVHTLLAKDPEARFATADALNEVLAEGEASGWWTDRERHGTRAVTARIGVRVPVRRETGLHGQQAALERIEKAWTLAREGHGNTILLEGEAGIGKTRLAAEVIERAASEDVHLLYGGYAPVGGIGGISEAILEHFGGGDLGTSLAPYLEVTPDLVPAFAAMLRHERPPTNAQPVEGDALHAVIVHLLRGMAAERPVLWVVDDLHNAHSESRALILSMARAVHGHRVLLLVATRPELPEEELAYFTRLDALQRSNLGRLSPREVMDLLVEATGSRRVADRLGGVIAHKSDGVPLFVFEILHALREQGVLKDSEGKVTIDAEAVDRIQVPSAVRDLLAARLGDLAQEERELLDAGAVQGFEFEAGLIAEVLGRRRMQVLQTLAVIERRTGVVRAEGLRYRFDHHQIQQVLYETLPEALRAEYHGALAQAYASYAGVGKDATGEAAVFLAMHHGLGPEPEAAMPYVDAALDHLEVSWRHQDAIDLIDRILLLGARVPLDTQSDLWLRRAQRASALGRRDEEREAVDRGLACADELADDRRRARALTLRGALLRKGSEADEAAVALEKARELAHRAGDARAEADAWLEHASLNAHRSEFEQARERFEHALMIAREAGDRRAEARAVGGIGSVLRAEDDLEASREHHEVNRKIAREIGNRPLEMSATGNLANVLAYMTREDEADEMYEQALAIAREIGNRPGEATLRGNWAGFLFTNGRFGDALAQFERALPLLEEIDHRIGQANVLVNLARLWVWLGHHDDTDACLGRAYTLTRELGVQRLEGYVWEVRGILDLHRGRYEDAIHDAERARAIFERLGNTIGVTVSYARSGLASLALGRLDDARGALEEAERGSRESGSQGGLALIACARVGLGGASEAEESQALESLQRQTSLLDRVQGYDYLYSHSRNPEYPRRACLALDTLLANSRPEHRQTMRANVPLFRRMLEARGDVAP